MDGQIDNGYYKKEQIDMQTSVLNHSLNVFEGDFLSLFGVDREDVHLKSGKTKSCVIFEL